MTSMISAATMSLSSACSVLRSLSSNRCTPSRAASTTASDWTDLDVLEHVSLSSPKQGVMAGLVRPFTSCPRHKMGIGERYHQSCEAERSEEVIRQGELERSAIA